MFFCEKIRCLAKKPEHRYVTYDDFLIDIIAVSKRLQIKLPKVVHVAKEDEELYAQAQSFVALGNKSLQLSTAVAALDCSSDALIPLGS